MVGIYNPNHFTSRPDSSLFNINFFNILCLNPFKIYITRFLKSQIQQLLLHLYLDRLWDWTPPKGVDIVILNNIKDWLIGTFSIIAIDRWAAVTYRG